MPNFWVLFLFFFSRCVLLLSEYLIPICIFMKASRATLCAVRFMRFSFVIRPFDKETHTEFYISTRILNIKKSSRQNKKMQGLLNYRIVVKAHGTTIIYANYCSARITRHNLFFFPSSYSFVCTFLSFLSSLYSYSCVFF